MAIDRQEEAATAMAARQADGSKSKAASEMFLFSRVMMMHDSVQVLASETSNIKRCRLSKLGTRNRHTQSAHAIGTRNRHTISPKHFGPINQSIKQKKTSLRSLCYEAHW
jgi:hypothetical protein